MATALQHRRGTTAQHSTFTGLVGEVTVDTDKDVLVVHDGSTAGGFPMVGENSPTDRPNIRPSLLLDFANSKTLDPRITFTRASTGTYYDGKTTAVAEQNLLMYSQDFDNAAWLKTNTTVTGNSTTAPDGTSTADAMFEIANTAFHGVQRQNTTISGVVHTASFYVKANGRNYCLIYTNAGSLGKYFDITAGGGGGVLGNYGSGPTSASITYVGNDWYRCSITFNTIGNSTSAEIYASDTGSNISYAGDITKGIYVWGAQLEQRSTVTAYTPTTSQPITNYIPALQTAAAGVPRFDHDPVTGESKGFLIEEQRTNLLTYSSDGFNSWGLLNSVVSKNANVAPDGTITAAYLIANASNSSHAMYQSTTLVGVGTVSFYAKAGAYSAVSIANAPNGWVHFNLTNGSVSSLGNGWGSASCIPIGNGWYRCSATNASSQNWGTVYIYALNSWVSNGNTSPEFTGDGYSGIYIWGAQLEAGSFPTSYIPTVASQVTRSADSASMTGANFSSWYRQDQGSWYFNGTVREDGSSSSYTNILLASASTYGGVGGGTGFAANSTGSNLYFSGGSGNAVPASLSTSGTTLSIAGAYALNDIAASSSGAAVVTSSTNTIQPCTALFIGNVSASYPMTGTIKRIAYYPKRLSNAELQAITS